MRIRYSPPLYSTMAPEVQSSPTAAQANGKAAAPKAGLEDVIAGPSSICLLDGKRGILAYRGYDFHDLVKGSLKETVYLLLYGKLRNASQLKEFEEKLVDHRKLPDGFKERIQNVPKNVHPMAALRTHMSALGFSDSLAESMSHEANIEKSIRMISAMPLIVAYFDAIRNGREMLEPKANLG